MVKQLYDSWVWLERIIFTIFVFLKHGYRGENIKYYTTVLTMVPRLMWVVVGCLFFVVSCHSLCFSCLLVSYPTEFQGVELKCAEVF